MVSKIMSLECILLVLTEYSSEHSFLFRNIPVDSARPSLPWEGKARTRGWESFLPWAAEGPCTARPECGFHPGRIRMSLLLRGFRCPPRFSIPCAWSLFYTHPCPPPPPPTRLSLLSFVAEATQFASPTPSMSNSRPAGRTPRLLGPCEALSLTGLIYTCYFECRGRTSL